MIGVSDLYFAEPRKWDAASNDAMVASRHCADLAATARDDVAATLKRCWVDETGQAARRKFVKQADQLESAADALRALATTYTKLAKKMSAAQRDLLSAVDYANKYELSISDTGKVTASTPDAPDQVNEKIKHVQPIIAAALKSAAAADTEAASSLRTIQGLTKFSDPELTRKALGDPNSPLAIALRISASSGALHRVNVGHAQLKAVERASRETGMSKTLLMSILWQEQQWYQNHSSNLKGPLPFFGRVFNWGLREAVKPDKSLGITHIKLETARNVIKSHPDKFVTDGRRLETLSDRELAKYIEENPNENIRLSAHYLYELQQDPHGASTDKQLFMIYAAESQQVRDSNEEYGDSTEERGGAIKRRAEAWDELQAPLEDAAAWEGLSESERQEARELIESQTPEGHHVEIEPIYGSGARGSGTGSPEPGTPSPAPGPPPTPPEG